MESLLLKCHMPEELFLKSAKIKDISWASRLFYIPYPFEVVFWRSDLPFYNIPFWAFWGEEADL